VSPRVVALVPARNEADRIGATISALRALPRVDEVVVVDDGSIDGTASVALASGAAVLRTGRRTGKGGALEGGLRRLPRADVWLFADADLGETAGSLSVVLEPVIEGRADLAIAVFPEGLGGGGFGAVKRTAARAIRVLSGLRALEPLSGQRALTAATLEAVRPLARGFGVETAMTVDAVRAGVRVVEVPADVSHRSTGRDVGGFAHRGRQALEIALAVIPRALGLR
jgi:hypothetical protein